MIIKFLVWEFYWIVVLCIDKGNFLEGIVLGEINNKFSRKYVVFEVFMRYLSGKYIRGS